MSSWMALLLLASFPGDSGEISYSRHIRPIFVQHCQSCHQPAKARGGYDITSPERRLQAGDSGRAPIVPGKPEASYLLELLQAEDSETAMPKGRPPLQPAQIEAIRRWILAGAVDDEATDERSARPSAPNPPIYTARPVVTALAFSPNGKSLAVSGYHEVLLFSSDGRELQGRFIGMSERIQSLAFSPDGTCLAVAGGSPGRFGEIQIWNMDNHELRQSIVVSNDVLFGLSWDPAGTMIAVGCTDHTVRGFEAATSRQVLQMGTHTDWVLGTVFSQDGTHLVSVSRDMSAKLTHVAEQRFIDNITSITPGKLKGGLMSVDRRPMATVRKQKLPKDTPNAVPQVYDELLLAGADGVPRIYMMHREVKREIGDDANHLRSYEPLPGRISAARFDARGNRFAVAASLEHGGEVRIVDVRTGKAIICEGSPGPVYTVAWHPNDQQIASGGFDGVIMLHEAATGHLLQTIEVLPKSDPRK